MENINKNNKITYKDFETYLPTYDFDDKQIQFFKDALETIVTNTDTLLWSSIFVTLVAKKIS